MHPAPMLLQHSAILLLALFLLALPAFADSELPASCSKVVPTAVIWVFAADSGNDHLPSPLPSGEYDPYFAESAVLAHYPQVQRLSATDVRRYPPELSFEIHIPPEHPAQLI